MKRLTMLNVLFIIIATLIIIGCDSEQIVQHNDPPPNDQVKALGSEIGDSKQVSEFILGQYIVVFKDQAEGAINSQAAQQAVQRTQSLLTKYRIPSDSLLFQYKYALKGFSAKLSSEQVDRLRRDPSIDRVSQARMFKVGVKKTELKSPVINTRSIMQVGQVIPWGVARVNGPLDGTGETAWIVDSGIDLDHPDLNVDVSNSVSFVANENADDQNGHGTHVAGIVAARDNSRDYVGVAAGASVIAIKICNSSGNCPETGYINGIDYISNQASSNDIVNISIWGPVDQDIDDAVTNAANNGVRLTLIAGNAAADANNYSPGRVNHPNIWTMSAYDDTDQFATAFSNFGNPPIEYAGPGVDVPSLWRNGGTNTISGTSMAAPHIAGLLLAVPNNIGTDGFVSGDPDGNPDAIAAVATEQISVTVSGPSLLNAGQMGHFSALVSDADGSVSYQWYYRNSPGDSWKTGGTGSSYQHTWYQEEIQAAVKVEVSSNGESDTDIHDVYITCSSSATTNNVKPQDPDPC